LAVLFRPFFKSSGNAFFWDEKKSDLPKNIVKSALPDGEREMKPTDDDVPDYLEANAVKL
jgi:hypothetical protein